jgi:hypothetical protein
VHAALALPQLVSTAVVPFADSDSRDGTRMRRRGAFGALAGRDDLTMAAAHATAATAPSLAAVPERGSGYRRPRQGTGAFGALAGDDRLSEAAAQANASVAPSLAAVSERGGGYHRPRQGTGAFGALAGGPPQQQEQSEEEQTGEAIWLPVGPARYSSERRTIAQPAAVAAVPWSISE